MNDPSKTIKELLEDGWNLSDSQHKNHITFQYGQTVDPKTRFTQRDIIIEVYPEGSGAGVQTRNQARSIYTEIVSIDCRVRFTASAQKSFENAKDSLHLIVEEVRRIIKLNRHDASDIFFMPFKGERPIDNVVDKVKYAGRVINVACKFNV